MGRRGQGYIRYPARSWRQTRSFRTDLYVGFDETQAGWKRTLLRFQDSQQARNIDIRGYGFDDRILNFNRTLASELRLEAPYAEAFQVELFPADHLQPTRQNGPAGIRR